MAWLSANWGWILAFVVALDSALAAIPSVEANSTFQLVTQVLHKLSGLSQPSAPPSA